MEFIKYARKEFGYKLNTLCDVLDISTKTFHKYKNRKDPDVDDYNIIIGVFEDTNQLYGYRRLKKAIKEKHGWVINHKKLLRIMRKFEIRVRYQKIYKKHFNKEYIENNTYPNLLNRNFNTTKLNQKWVTDVTYLVQNGNRAYLSTIMDLHTRNIIASRISYRNDNELVMDTLKEALDKQKDVSGLIIHSDQGVQYTSTIYKVICETHGISISMSRKGCPQDNAPIESFHASLKRETLYSYDIKSLQKYIQLVIDWIKFYNTDRLRLT
ncbi:IS3 family transposase [Mycoplasmatota bacterium WC44]